MRCPRCDAPVLETRNFLRATIVIDGRPAAAYWTYLECPQCQARFKRDQQGRLSQPSATEWQQYGHVE